MARTKSRISEQVPSLKNWGGVRSISRRMERSATIVENRLVKQVSDTFQKLRSRVSALLSTLRQRVQNALAKKQENNS